MVLDLAQHHGVSLARAILVGDSESDEFCACRWGRHLRLGDTFFGQ
jgi:hypothetical protein